MDNKWPSAELDKHQHADAFLNYEAELKRYLGSRLGNRYDAEDLAQEAYLRLSRVKKQTLIRNPEAYLFKIANNLVNEFLIERSKSKKYAEQEARLQGDDESGVQEDQAERHERTRHLEDILDQLPAMYRAVLLLRKRDGFSHAEIAERLEISPHTVHTYLKRALLQCRILWAGYE